MFNVGVKYLPGGVASGFTDVDAEPVEKRLFEVKGKRNIKVKQVTIEGGKINKSDCWILDEGKGGKILVYMPPGASKMEQFKATHAANQIRDEDHAGSATVEILSKLYIRFNYISFDVLASPYNFHDLPSCNKAKMILFNFR